MPGDPGDAPPPDQATTASLPQSIADAIDILLRSRWSPEGPERQEDGSLLWVVPHGSASIQVILLEPTGPAPILRYQTVLLRDVPTSPELLATLNELNARDPFHKLYAVDEVVLQEYDQMAGGGSALRVLYTLNGFVLSADQYDTVLRERHGGRLHGGDVTARFHA